MLIASCHNPCAICCDIRFNNEHQTQQIRRKYISNGIYGHHRDSEFLMYLYSTLYTVSCSKRLYVCSLQIGQQVAVKGSWHFTMPPQNWTPMHLLPLSQTCSTWCARKKTQLGMLWDVKVSRTETLNSQHTSGQVMSNPTFFYLECIILNLKFRKQFVWKLTQLNVSSAYYVLYDHCSRTVHCYWNM